MSELLKKYNEALQSGKIQTPFAKFNPLVAGTPTRKYETVSDERTAVQQARVEFGSRIYTEKKQIPGPLSQPFVLNNLNSEGRPLRADTQFINADGRFLPVVSLPRDAERVGRFLFGIVGEATKFVTAIASRNPTELLKLDFRRGFLLTYYLAARQSAYERRDPNFAAKGLSQLGRHFMGYIPDVFMSKDLLDELQRDRGIVSSNSPFQPGQLSPIIKFNRNIDAGEKTLFGKINGLKNTTQYAFSNVFYYDTYKYTPTIGKFEGTKEFNSKKTPAEILIFNNTRSVFTSTASGSYYSLPSLPVQPTSSVKNRTDENGYVIGNELSGSQTPVIKLRTYTSSAAAADTKQNPIPFYFKIGNESNADLLQFPNTIRSVTEQVNATYEQTEYINYNIVWQKYKSTSRTIDLTFTLHADNSADLQILYEKLNKLTATTFGTKSTGAIIRPLILFLTIGNLYKDQPVVINSLSKPIITEQNTWDIDGKLPNTMDLTVNMNILEKSIPTLDTKFHNN